MQTDERVFHPAATRLVRCTLLAVLSVASSLAQAQAVPSPGRGQLLYETHCIACHTTQMHWRNDKRAKDWDSLKEQVRRWQGNAGLQWSDADINAVAQHLNETIYRYPREQRVGSASVGLTQR
jgi:mono/diheme cytochrome c family protein